MAADGTLTADVAAIANGRVADLAQGTGESLSNDGRGSRRAAQTASTHVINVIIYFDATLSCNQSAAHYFPRIKACSDIGARFREATAMNERPVYDASEYRRRVLDIQKQVVTGDADMPIMAPRIGLETGRPGALRDDETGQRGVTPKR